MAKKEITKRYEAVVYHHFFLNKAMRVGLEVDVITGRVDVLARKGREYIFIEIKTSVQDFRSKNGHNFFGTKNYYAMPEKVFEKVKHRIPKHIGVYTIVEGDWGRPKLSCLKNSKTVDMPKEIGKGRYKWSKQKYIKAIDENLLTACNSAINRLMKPWREKWVKEE
jgi:hypothetical protein